MLFSEYHNHHEVKDFKFKSKMLVTSDGVMCLVVLVYQTHQLQPCPYILKLLA